MSYRENIDLWEKFLPVMDQSLKNEFINMNEQQLKEAFSDELEFGTAGLRGIIGAGSGKMNIYTIRKATLAFIRFLQEKHGQENLQNQGILIGHDNRHFSKEFAQQVADILTTNNIKAILFKDNDLRPTPLVSYSVAKVNAVAGIIITASHNPRIYNGYKIYDENGCQFLPLATDIIGNYYLQYKEAVFDLDLKPNFDLLEYVSESIEQNYIDDVKSLQFYPNQKRDIKIVFSNLHGTSKEWTPLILQQTGYEVIFVQEQFNNDPDFTYAPNPNPELSETFDLAIKYGIESNADLLLLNDPDADRVGIAVKLKDDKYYLMSGNETAAVLIEYLFSHYQENNMLPKNGVMYNTFVSSDLTDKIAKNYNVKVIKTLTGFKWIGGEMLLEKSRNLQFLFGFEEAYGYVLKNITHDKDGIQPSLVLAEACQYYKNQGLNLYDVLENLYQKYGYYYCHTVNLTCQGINGKSEIQNMLDTLRNKTIDALYGLKLTKKEDYLHGLYNMPSQDLLKFYFEHGSWFAVRASGTEPKIKFYFVCVDKSTEKARFKMQKMFNELEEKYLK